MKAIFVFFAFFYTRAFAFGHRSQRAIRPRARQEFASLKGAIAEPQVELNKEMFFGFVATYAPSIKRTIRSSLGPCPICASQVDLVELANTLSIFFIPIWTRQSKEFVYCRSCKYTSSPLTYERWQQKITSLPSEPSQKKIEASSKCAECGKRIREEWEYCPRCGVQQPTK
jgi:hypothetical protein